MGYGVASSGEYHFKIEGNTHLHLFLIKRDAVHNGKTRCLVGFWICGIRRLEYSLVFRAVCHWVLVFCKLVDTGHHQLVPGGTQGRTHAVRFLFPFGWRSESARCARESDVSAEEEGSSGLLAEELGLSSPASSTRREGGEDGEDEDAGVGALGSIVEVPIRSQVTNACSSGIRRELDKAGIGSWE